MNGISATYDVLSIPLKRMEIYNIFGRDVGGIIMQYINAECDRENINDVIDDTHVGIDDGLE